MLEQIALCGSSKIIIKFKYGNRDLPYKTARQLALPDQRSPTDRLQVNFKDPLRFFKANGFAIASSSISEYHDADQYGKYYKSRFLFVEDPFRRSRESDLGYFENLTKERSWEYYKNYDLENGCRVLRIYCGWPKPSNVSQALPAEFVK